MNESTCRQRLIEKGYDLDEVDALLDTLAEQRNDDARDRKAEEHYQGHP